jgi:hypothetical protein
MTVWRSVWAPGLLVASAIACSLVAPAPATSTATSEPTLPPTQPPPTDTGLPALPPTIALPPAPATPTRAPQPPPGPIVFQDGFAFDQGAWSGCDYCSIRDGALHFGPCPISGAFIQHYAVCDACGQPITYRMSVDATYGEGDSEPGRGFGFLLRATADYILIVEINPFQSIDVWRLEANADAWDWVNGVMSGAVSPGRSSNHVGVEATRSQTNTINIAIRVNETTPLIVYNQPADPGWVGLTLYGHTLEVVFDNFEFEELEYQ